MYCVTMGEETHVLLYTHLHEYTVSCATILRWVMLQWQQHTVHVVLCMYAYICVGRFYIVLTSTLCL